MATLAFVAATVLPPASSSSASDAFHGKSSCLPLTASAPRSFPPKRGSVRIPGPLPIRAVQEVAAKTDLFDQAQEKILSKLKDNPELRPVISEKLASIAEELEHLSTGTYDNAAVSPVERIKKGFQEFKISKFLKNSDVWDKLAEGQSPKFMVIACSDSRVCPTEVLGFKPGEAFVVRNVANMVPSRESGRLGTSSALEYGVLHLKVENILIIGHSRCGGIKALMSQQDGAAPWSEFIENWIETGTPARITVKAANGAASFDQLCSHCEREAVNLSLKNLLTFPWIKEAVSNKKLALHGGYFNFVDGSFEYWPFDEEVGEVTKF